MTKRTSVDEISIGYINMFISNEHKASWINYYKFPILEGSHYSADT
jgi:hypothetical protein